MPSLRQLSTKLQTALCQKGRHIKVNQFQSYSEKAGRMVTKFVLQETKQNDAGKVTTVTHLIELVDAYGNALTSSTCYVPVTTTQVLTHTIPVQEALNG